MKRLQVLFVLLFAVFFTYTVVAQEAGSVRRNYKLTIPEKIQKLVLDPLPAGTYSVGTGGYFPTIDSAFNKLSVDGIDGEVILELIDNLYTALTGQYGYVLNGPVTGSGAASRITLRPADNVDVTIQGDGEAVLVFNDVSYLTIDGINLQGDTRLKVHAFYNSTGTQWNDAIDFYGDCDYVQVKNLTASSDDVNRYSAGVFFANTAQAAPDSGLVSGLSVPVANAGIYLLGDGTYNPTGFVISNNHMGSPNDSLSSWGIQNQTADGTIIENNHIENMRKGNFFYGLYFIYGIQSFNSDNVIIRNNVIHNIAATNGPTRLQGIFVSGDVGERGSNNWVYNNMVYDIRTYTSNVQWLGGIFVGDHDSPRIEFNSVNLTEGNDNSPTSGSAAVWIHPTVTSPTIRNNILVNTRDDSPYSASAMLIHSSLSTLTSDYNDLYCDDTYVNNYLVRTSGTNYKTLAEWQATGKDLHSVTEMPNFIAPDLHIDESIATNLEKRAAPISGIDNDCDDEVRNLYLPDIGADEFDGTIPPGALSFGTYSVGTNGFFNTIESVFDKLETDGIDGAVTFELIDNLYTAPTDSFGFKLVGPIPGAGPDSRVTIKPGENKNVTIEGNGQNVLFFLNTSYLTLDGVDLSGATTLTVHSITNTQFDKNNAVGVYENSDYNEIKNLVVSVEDYLRNSRGIFVAGGTNPQSVPDSNLIMNNFIKKAGVAIYVRVTTSSIIRGNNIGSETDSLISWGIQSEVNINTLIEENHVQNLRFGVFNECPGIDSYVDDGCVIRNNVVHNIDGKNAVDGGFGIELSGDNGNPGVNNMVYNNMVYDIRSSSNRASGIQLWYVDNSKIYYNTVYLFGNGTGTTTNGSAALYISHSCTNVEAKNNILVNTRDESPYYASAIYDYSASNLTSDYNDLYSANYLVRIGSTNYNTLADWQQTRKDKHSITEMPNFIEPYLHINESIPTNLEKGASPIEGIDTDFDEDTRNTTTPDIGADEFDGVVAVNEEIPLPIEFALEQNYPNPFNPSTKISWQSPVSSWQTLKIFDVLGNEIATLVNEEKPAGTYEVTWNAVNLPSGVYFYQLKAGDYTNTKKMILLK